MEKLQSVIGQLITIIAELVKDPASPKLKAMFDKAQTDLAEARKSIIGSGDGGGRDTQN